MLQSRLKAGILKKWGAQCSKSATCLTRSQQAVKSVSEAVHRWKQQSSTDIKYHWLAISLLKMTIKEQGTSLLQRKKKWNLKIAKSKRRRRSFKRWRRNTGAVSAILVRSSQSKTCSPASSARTCASWETLNSATHAKSAYSAETALNTGLRPEKYVHCVNLAPASSSTSVKRTTCASCYKWFR